MRAMRHAPTTLMATCVPHRGRLSPKRRSRRDEHGASLVEFALVLPVFMMLVLGMFTGGLAYNRKLAVTQASREAARFGATYPLAAEANIDNWLTTVTNIAVSSSDGELGSSSTGRVICVAYLSPSQTRQRTLTGTSVAFANSSCFTDGRPSNETRVQVVSERTSTLEALAFSRDLILRSQGVARFEAFP